MNALCGLNNNTTLRVIKILSPGVEIGIARQLAANANPEGGARGHLARRGLREVARTAVVNRKPEAVPGIAVIERFTVAGLPLACSTDSMARGRQPPALPYSSTRLHADADRSGTSSARVLWSAPSRRACHRARGHRQAFAVEPDIGRAAEHEMALDMKDFRCRQVPAAINHQPQGIARSLRPAQNGCKMQGLGVPGGTRFVFLLAVGILAAVGNEVAAREFAAAGQIDRQR